MPNEDSMFPFEKCTQTLYLAKTRERVAPIGWRNSLLRNWLNGVICGRACVNASTRAARAHQRSRKMVKAQSVASINTNYPNQLSKRLYCISHLGIIRSQLGEKIDNFTPFQEIDIYYKNHYDCINY